MVNVVEKAAESTAPSQKPKSLSVVPQSANFVTTVNFFESTVGQTKTLTWMIPRSK